LNIDTVPKYPGSIHGVLVINKPVGPSSHDVVICARRALGISRIGHTGTLDPPASGVLPLVIGQATRLAQHLTATDKEYVATLRFGIVTDTYDSSGVVLHETGQQPTVEDVRAALERFRGASEQRPPLYSAKMVDGERSYVRARAGKPLQPRAVAVTAHELELLDHEGRIARLRVRCSAGFYIRSLAHDLGEVLGSGAILEALLRTEAAGFTIDDAVPFEALVRSPRGELSTQVKPLESLLPNLPVAMLTDQGLRSVLHGRDLGRRELAAPLPAAPPLVRLIAPDGHMVGLARPSKTPGLLHPALVFSYN